MGVAERREREKAARRSEILRSARELFYATGYERTKMADIAAACELSKGAVYLYYQNKTELARAVVNESYDVLLELIRTAATNGQTGAEKAANMLQAFQQFYRHHYQSFYLTLVLESHLRDHITATGEQPEYNERLDEMKTIGRDVIREGIQDGSLRKDLNPDVVAVTLVNAAAGFFHRIVTYGVLVPEAGVETEDYVAEFLGILLRALAPVNRSAG